MLAPPSKIILFLSIPLLKLLTFILQAENWRVILLFAKNLSSFVNCQAKNTEVKMSFVGRRLLSHLLLLPCQRHFHKLSQVSQEY